MITTKCKEHGEIYRYKNSDTSLTTVYWSIRTNYFHWSKLWAEVAPNSSNLGKKMLVFQLGKN